jgi:hypothetical protein
MTDRPTYAMEVRSLPKMCMYTFTSGTMGEVMGIRFPFVVGFLGIFSK